MLWQMLVPMIKSQTDVVTDVSPHDKKSKGKADGRYGSHCGCVFSDIDRLGHVTDNNSLFFLHVSVFACCCQPQCNRGQEMAYFKHNNEAGFIPDWPYLHGDALSVSIQQFSVMPTEGSGVVLVYPSLSPPARGGRVRIWGGGRQPPPPVDTTLVQGAPRLLASRTIYSGGSGESPPPRWNPFCFLFNFNSTGHPPPPFTTPPPWRRARSAPDIEWCQRP